GGLATKSGQQEVEGAAEGAEQHKINNHNRQSPRHLPRAPAHRYATTTDVDEWSHQVREEDCEHDQQKEALEGVEQPEDERDPEHDEDHAQNRPRGRRARGSCWLGPGIRIRISVPQKSFPVRQRCFTHSGRQNSEQSYQRISPLPKSGGRKTSRTPLRRTEL